MKTTHLYLASAADAALDGLPSYTKSPFASTSIASAFGLLAHSIEVLSHERPNRQATVIDFSRLCANAFGGDCLKVLVFERGRVAALLTAHGAAYAATLDTDLTNVALILGSILNGAPKVFRGMVDPLSKRGS